MLLAGTLWLEQSGFSLKRLDLGNLGELCGRMLNFLRAKQHSVFVKIFLGLIGFLLVAFFGVRNNEDTNQQTDQLASVNGVPVTARMVEYKLEQKLEELKTIYNMAEFPPNLLTSLRANVVENVIQIELMHQNIKTLGLDTQDAELSQKIKETFVQDGAFNRDFYLGDFVPSYEAQTGHAFEDDFRQQLAAEKVLGTFDALFKMSDEEALKIYNWQNTKFRYTVVKVPKFKKKDSAPTAETSPETATAGDDANLEEPDPSAQITAAQIFDQWSKGGDIGKLTKPLNLAQRVTSNLSPIQLERVFDGEAEFEETLAIAKLTAAKPFPDKVFEKDKFFYLVKLDAKLPAPDKPEAKDLESIKTNYQNEMANTLQSNWIDALQAKAKISRSPKI